jgi:NarL family two-component system sensor histidine kinase LiaS
MKKWLDNRCPAFMRKLWCQLAVTYTLLAICALAVIIMIMYGFNDYKDYRLALTPDNVQARALSEQITLAEALRDGGDDEWQKRAIENIRHKLIHLENADDDIEIYRITNSSIPEVYIRITDANGNPVISDPLILSPSMTDQFTLRQRETITEAKADWLSRKEGTIWIEAPVQDKHSNIIGRLQLIYIAQYNWWVQIGSVINFLIAAFDWVLICSVPTGIACGLVASRYVTKQLHKINEVTESWRQADFKPRIALPSDDVLIRHSKFLNDMAEDLEMYFNLKQNLAVHDERNRVARELHDTVKQKLFALGLQLATAKAKPPVMEAASEHILEAETITREAQHDLMEIITQLRPTGAGNTSLAEHINMIANDFHRRFDVSITLKNAEPIECAAHTEHHILRIVHESLMNAVRHGQADKITISLHADQDQATLIISDNGGGFDTKQKTAGFGLVSMRDRVRDLPGGVFDIQSDKGKGTQINLSWKVE